LVEEPYKSASDHVYDYSYSNEKVLEGDGFTDHCETSH
jgi:hypothetical protein